MFAPAVVVVGYNQTTVTVLESDRVAQLQLRSARTQDGTGKECEVSGSDIGQPSLLE